MLPPETDDTIPEHPFKDRHETLSKEEMVPSRSHQERMRRDPEYREWIEAHD